MPLTAYLTKMWGTRPFYVIASIAFIVTSVATGLSTNVDMMIFTRALQGLAAGAMIPPIFATAMTVFPPERRLTANIVVGLIVTLAPTIGPTLGGHLTEALKLALAVLHQRAGGRAGGVPGQPLRQFRQARSPARQGQSTGRGWC